MRHIPLGDTGIQVSEVGFGGIPIIRLESEQAQRVVRHALDRGVNFIDTAHMYLDSEEKIGKAIAGRRREVALASKTIQRQGGPALEQLETSLRRIGTEHIELYQFHQVSQDADLDALLAPGGAYEALSKARDAGKIGHLGISSHNLAMAIRLVETGLFATIQFPLNFIETAALDELIPKARAAGMAYLAMKPFAGGMIDSARIAFAYLRQHPECIPLPGFDTTHGVDEVLDLYEAPNAVDEEARAGMERIVGELGGRFCRRCEYCQPCPQGVRITPAMMYRVVSIRMSPRTAASFSAVAMESVRQCVDCGECLEKCPYGLPIPEMLREHLELYDAHRLLPKS
ncbi:aldo/keto reductase [Fundidesulfovibrio agrisoli]|uniref:aldo/keto reductase n=1 Tax=Fundidesulfovibrio agrisoli TaxID=2922717 RepID=UPI001FAC84DF|nr:aldo/keto reductase [Fundidesulfovibrio agrisoli]